MLAGFGMARAAQPDLDEAVHQMEAVGQPVAQLRKAQIKLCGICPHRNPPQVALVEVTHSAHQCPQTGPVKRAVALESYQTILWLSKARIWAICSEFSLSKTRCCSRWSSDTSSKSRVMWWWGLRTTPRPPRRCAPPSGHSSRS